MFLYLKEIFNFSYSKCNINISCFFKFDYYFNYFFDDNNLEFLENYDEDTINNNSIDLKKKNNLEKKFNYNSKCNHCNKNINKIFYMYNDNMYCSDLCRFTVYNMNNKND